MIPKPHPSRGETDGETGALEFGKVLTIEQYRKNINKRMLSTSAADMFRWECIQQPNFRRDMQMDEDYYDGHQMSADILADLEDRGVPPIVTNLIGPTIDVIMGMEAQNRRDFMVRPEDDPQWDDVAAALNQKLKTAERLSGADRACSEAYDNQVKGGLGWVHVSRATDPYDYRYQASWVDWREMDYDPRGNSMTTKDWRFIRRMRYFDRDHLEAQFQDKAQLIHELGTSLSEGTTWSDTRELLEAPMLRGGSHGPWRDYSTTELEFVDYDRNRLKLEEIWYRVYVKGRVIELPDGSSVVFNEKDEAHVFAVESGRASLRYASWPEMRLSYWVGPLALADVPSPFPFRDFPYVPFIGMREGRTHVPYGVIRRMRPMQDEINARNSKLMWALSARRVIADPDAVQDHDSARIEVSRPDAYVMLNEHRRPSSRFEVQDNIDISSQQFTVLQDRIAKLQDVAGVYNAMRGKEDSRAESGVAIRSLIDQGTTTLAPLNDNFMLARQMVGDRLLALVIQDMEGQKDVPVQVDGARGKRVIRLNQPKVHDHTQLEIVHNNVKKARLKVVLDDMPATATFRQQQFQRIAEMLTNMAKFAPETAVKFMDLLVEASDVPNKDEFVDRIREVIGLAKDPSTMSPEEQAAAEQQAKEKAQLKELQMRDALADLAIKEGKATETEARIEKIAADTQQIMVRMEEMLKGMQLTAAKVAETEAKTEETLQDIEHQDAAMASGQIAGAEQSVQYRW